MNIAYQLVGGSECKTSSVIYWTLYFKEQCLYYIRTSLLIDRQKEQECYKNCVELPGE